MQLLVECFFIQLPKRTDIIDDNDSSSVRGDHQIVGLLVELNEMDVNGRHIIGELIPVLSSVKGNVKPELGSKKQQIFILIVFLDVTCKTINVGCNNRLPG